MWLLSPGRLTSLQINLELRSFIPTSEKSDHFKYSVRICTDTYIQDIWNNDKNEMENKRGDIKTVKSSLGFKWYVS